MILSYKGEVVCDLYIHTRLVYTRKLEQLDQVVFVRCAGRIFKQIYLVVRLRVLICS